MAIDQLLVLTGVALISSAAGAAAVLRGERRRAVRRVADEAQAWLDDHSDR